MSLLSREEARFVDRSVNLAQPRLNAEVTFATDDFLPIRPG